MRRRTLPPLSRRRLRWLALGVVPAYACGDPGGIGLPPIWDNQNLGGADITPYGDCGTDSVVDGINFLCSYVNGSGAGFHCTSHNPQCRSSSREIFTGVDVGAPFFPNPSWNEFGGRGSALANGALCQLQDLQNGPLVLGARDPSQGGAQETIGFLHYDPTNHVVSGYHRVALCLPYVGCFDALTQRFDAQATSTSLGPFWAFVGDYPVSSTWGLRVRADELAAESFQITAPSIPVETAIGEFDVTLAFAWGMDAASRQAQLATSAFPFQGTVATQSQFHFIPPGPTTLSDLLGQYNGLSFSENPPPITAILGDGLPAGAGWASQLGLGSRDGSPGPLGWTPDDPFRPDLDLSRARSTDEQLPVVAASLSGDVRHDLPIPDEVRAIPSATFSGEVAVNVAISADVASQLELYAAEARHNYIDPEFRGHSNNRRVFQIDHRLTTAFSVTVTPRLLIDFDPHIPFVGAVHIDERYGVVVPIASPSSSALPGIIESVDLSQPTSGPTYTRFVTVRDPLGSIDGDNFVAQCLAQGEQAQPLPAPSYTPPPPDQPFYAPCNVCLGYSDPTGAIFNYFKVYHSEAPPENDWTCNPSTVGCHDLCLGKDVIKPAQDLLTNTGCSLAPQPPPRRRP